VSLGVGDPRPAPATDRSGRHRLRMGATVVWGRDRARMAAVSRLLHGRPHAAAVLLRAGRNERSVRLPGRGAAMIGLRPRREALTARRATGRRSARPSVRSTRLRGRRLRGGAAMRSLRRLRLHGLLVLHGLRLVLRRLRLRAHRPALPVLPRLLRLPLSLRVSLSLGLR
jgi:hypothetical protein